MIARRSFLLGSAAALVGTPANVGAASLTPESSAPSTARPAYGFAQRLYVSANLRPIVDLLAAGLSPSEAAGVMNWDGRRALNGLPWEAASVASPTLALAEQRTIGLLSGQPTKRRGEPTRAWRGEGSRRCAADDP
jgi:hypothetical protein